MTLARSRKLISGLVVLCILTGCHSESESHKTVINTPKLPADEVLLPKDSPKRAYIEETLLELSAAPVAEPVTGKIAYDETRTARITSPLAGRLISSLPPLGKVVKAREPLVELDSPDLGQAKEDYSNAVAERQLAEESYRRAKMLFDGQVLARKELQQAEDNAIRARNEVQRTLLRLQNLGVDDQNINNRYFIRSPIAGLITERHVNPGMEVRPDFAEPLFVVSDLRSLWVQLNVFEKDLGLIHTGKKVMVSVPAYPSEKFPAVVDYIDKVVDENTRTVKVRCVMQNPGGRLLPAMFATVELKSEAENRGIVVPLSALFTEGEGDQVFVVMGDGHYKRRDVKVGLRQRDRGVIIQGLKPGETIVSKGALMLRTEEANVQNNDAVIP